MAKLEAKDSQLEALIQLKDQRHVSLRVYIILSSTELHYD